MCQFSFTNKLFVTCLLKASALTVLYTLLTVHQVHLAKVSMFVYILNKMFPMVLCPTGPEEGHHP